MPTDLLSYVNHDVLVALAQACAAIALCMVVVLLCRQFDVKVEREAVVSLGRGLVQMVLVGFVLALLVHGTLLIGVVILLLMTIAAAFTAARRAKSAKGSLMISFWAIGIGSGLVLAAMIAIGALQTNITILVPVGSMIIANSMNSCAQAAERFHAEVRSHTGLIETGLALGADPPAAVAPYVRSAVYASLLPRLDMMKSLGLVWIPGVMAGMVLSGASPLQAGIYQFIIVAMILAGSGLSGLVVTVLLRVRAFTPAAQLALAAGAASR